MADDALARVVEAVQDADANRVPEALREALLELGVTETILWLSDYRESHLVDVTSHWAWQVGDDRVIPVDGSDQGRAFASGRPFEVGGRIHVPVTVRGDRRGVLEMAPVIAEPHELLRVARVVGSAVAEANRVSDRYVVSTRVRPMTVAAEMQRALLPGTAYRDDEVEVAGLVEPAYTVGGDCFDWSRSDDSLQVTVIDAGGRGISPAQTGALALTASRNARRGGADIAEQAAEADRALFAVHGGEQWAAALWIELDLRTGDALAVATGTLNLLRVRTSGVREQKLVDQPYLGKAGRTRYTAEHVHKLGADRIVIVSDGLSAAASSDSDPFGKSEMSRTLRQHLLLPPAETVRAILAAMSAYRGEHELSDDAVALCLDWASRD